MATIWKVALTKVEFMEEEYSLHPTCADAQVAVGDLENFLGLEDAEEVRLVAKCSPVTGEWFLIDIGRIKDE